MVTAGELFAANIRVNDTNLRELVILNGPVQGGSLTRDDNDISLYTFTWIPAPPFNRTIIFLATDDLNANFRYEPIIEICQCENGGNCTLNGILDRTANPIDLNCICSEGEYTSGDHVTLSYEILTHLM